MDIHGGNLDLIEKIYNVNKKDIIDFSDNINPLGASSRLKENIGNIYNLLNLYPDEDYTDLRSSISKYTNCNTENILVGNGATELISALIKAVNPKNSLIILPTYSEYEKELKKINSHIIHFDVLEEDHFKLNVDMLISTITPDINLLVFCNPNNPTGYLTPKEDVKKILSHCKKTNTVVLLDETYVEFSKESTGATSLVETYDNLFIIRGTSKFFAISGLRLGYALTSSQQLRDNVAKTLIPWNVNIVAEYLGQLVFSDEEFIKNSISLCNREYTKIKNFFDTIDSIYMFESDTNFILFKIITEDFSAKNVFEYMIKHNIIVRNLTNSKGLSEKYFRICIQKPEHNDLFIEQFKAFLNSINQ